MTRFSSLRAHIPSFASQAVAVAALLFASANVAYGQEEDDAATPEASDSASDKEAAEEEELPDVDLIRTLDRPKPPGTPIIANKKFPMAMRFEGTASVDISYGQRYVKQYGGHLAAGFHILDWLAIEGYVGYFGVCSVTFDPASCEESITQYARHSGQSATQGSQLYLTDLWQTNLAAGLTVQWAPIYGKLSAVSEYDLNFQLYLLGGAGIDGLWKVVSENTGEEISKEMKWAPTFVVPSMHFGAGLRFIPFKHVAFRAELRNYLHIAPGPIAAPGETVEDFDIGYNSMLNLGASFLF
ncbi:MAG: outer membrane beta-barrel domain-containing protein [Deltaproteobacteria bacterium]|nr:outer membrane beta-barrel domain-containing protein [Deltaproteobacteria bacterium]